MSDAASITPQIWIEVFPPPPKAVTLSKLIPKRHAIGPLRTPVPIRKPDVSMPDLVRIAFASGISTPVITWLLDLDNADPKVTLDRFREVGKTAS